jgi:hypothetical protein
MGRGIYRSGLGSILTAEQLSSNLALPVYRIVTGTATVIFPQSDTSHQSPYVWVISSGKSGPSYQYEWAANLPMVVNWLQWERVIVPVLLDERTQGWLGVLRTPNGTPVYLSNSVINANNQIAVTTGGKVLEAGTEIGQSQISGQAISRLLSTEEYIRLISRLILERANDTN